MKQLIKVSLLLVAALAYGCNGDDDDTGMDASVTDRGTADTGVTDTGVTDTGVTDTGVTDTGVVADGGTPIPLRPTLGTQLDRSGRPAVNTALIAPLADQPAQGTRKDAYNAAGIADWGDFHADIQANLGLYDGLDGVCGNQFLAGAGTTTSSPDRYNALANALTDDRLYLNSASSACNQYLAVELDALGMFNDDCGGRTLTYDVIDFTYSALAIGAVAGVGDGIASDNVAPSNTDFPFLAAP